MRTVNQIELSDLASAESVVGEPPQTYREWNDALASKIFRPDMAGREVFLFVNDDLIEELGGSSGVPDFVRAVKQGMPWVNQDLGLCQQALHTLDGWRDRGLSIPPYIAYLGLFVLAIGVQGDFAAHAYYARLRTLLGWPDVDAGTPASFDRMIRLWEDLEVWSNRDRRGELGVFSIRIAGEWINVGLPKAQAVLTEPERKGLSAIFTVATLDATAPQSDEQLAHTLRRHGADILRATTLTLLANRSSEPELFSVLLDAVRQELEEWDGEASDVGETDGYAVTATARLCLRVDEIAGRVSTTLRLAARPDFPEDGLTLQSSDESIHLTCNESLPGWSSPLREPATSHDFSASELDWSKPAVLMDRNTGWRVRLPGDRVRIFVSGRSLGLPGDIEVRRLPLNSPFTLVASDKVVPALDRWAESGQADLKQIDIVEGLPAGWKLFRSTGATQDDAVRKTLPELSLPSTISIRLAGGIRSGMGNTYFKFAPPMITVEGASGGEAVFCNGQRLTQAVDGTGTFALPAHIEAGSPITVEITANDEVLRRQSLFLASDLDWNLKAPLFSMDKSGAVHECGEEAGDGVAGALLTAESPQGFPVRPDISSARRVILIGRRPGQIKSFSTRSNVDAWEPVWLVELGRRGRAEYCGLNLAESGPLADSEGVAEDQELWRDVLWHRRKRIEPPGHPKLRALWRNYVEAARVPAR
jgi:hypothetical protein